MRGLRPVAAGIAYVVDRLGEGRLSLRAAITEICRQTRDSLGCAKASIWIFEPRTRRVALLGGVAPEPGPPRWPGPRRLTRQEVDRLRQHWLVAGSDGPDANAGDVLLAGVSVNGEMVGVLRLGKPLGGAWRREQVQLARAIAKQLSLLVARGRVSRAASPRVRPVRAPSSVSGGS